MSEMGPDMWRLSLIKHKCNPGILNVNNNDLQGLLHNNTDGKYILTHVLCHLVISEKY